MTMYMTPEALHGVAECPHCHRANPALAKLSERLVVDLGPLGQGGVYWIYAAYRCTTCQGGVLAASQRVDRGGLSVSQLIAREIYPSTEAVSDTIPERPRKFLQDAQNSLSAASASIMASCSAIDAMLKEKNVGRMGEDGRERSLKKRIDLAVEKNILTVGMSEWAHRVRLDANDQRHADENAPIPNDADARQTLRLAKAIAELLFILPSELPNAASGSDKVGVPQKAGGQS